MRSPGLRALRRGSGGCKTGVRGGRLQRGRRQQRRALGERAAGHGARRARAAQAAGAKEVGGVNKCDCATGKVVQLRLLSFLGSTGCTGARYLVLVTATGSTVKN